MKLLSIDTNAKLAKSTAVHGDDYVIAGLSLFPSATLCPASKAAGCFEACLQSAGRGAMPNVIAGRKRKAEWYETDRTGFMVQLVSDLEALVRRANRQGKRAACRLNVLQDIKWEEEPCVRNGKEYAGVPQAFPEVIFYDYTKRNLRQTPDNYHLTFSYSSFGNFAGRAETALAAGFNIAVVFRGGLPSEFLGRPVIDGDKHDLRFLDQEGVIVGLTAKGKAKADTTGFVIDNPQLLAVA